MESGKDPNNKTVDLQWVCSLWGQTPHCSMPLWGLMNRGQAGVGCSELGRELAKPCLSSCICRSAAGMEPEGGTGTDFGVEVLAKAPQAAEPLEWPCLVMRRGQGGLLLGHCCSVHGGCIREQCGSRAGITELSSVNGFKQQFWLVVFFGWGFPELHKCSWLSQLIVNDMGMGGKWITEATGKLICRREIMPYINKSFVLSLDSTSAIRYQLGIFVDWERWPLYTWVISRLKRALWYLCKSHRKSLIETNGSWTEAKTITCLFVVVA